jgi:hypothetical protein
VRVNIDTDLSNDWAYFNLALLPENGGSGYEVGREISNYGGVEEGEAWHEGSSKDRVTIPSVPPGRYYLRVQPDRDTAGRPFLYTLSVWRDVPRIWPFFVALGLLGLAPLFAVIGAASFEQQRWAESDHAPTGGDDDDE